MFKHLWVERGMLSGLTKNICILVIVILSSTLAAGIVQDSLLEKLGEAKWRRLEATSATRTGNSSRFLAIEFLSQITNTRTRIRNVRTYVRIYYENLDLD